MAHDTAGLSAEPSDVMVVERLVRLVLGDTVGLGLGLGNSPVGGTVGAAVGGVDDTIIPKLGDRVGLELGDRAGLELVDRVGGAV